MCTAASELRSGEHARRLLGENAQPDRLQTMNDPMHAVLKLEPVNDGVFAVLNAHGQHLGNLKRVGAVWKFKAVGYTAMGAVEPGGGPLTHRHNAVFKRPDGADVSAVLLAG